MKSIKLKLLLIFSAIILCLCTGIGVFTTTIVTNQLVQDAHGHLLDMAAEEAKYVQARVEGRITYISSLAQNPILLDKNLAFEQKVAFFEAEAQRTGYLAFAFADPEGNSTVFNSKRETTNITKGSDEYTYEGVAKIAAYVPIENTPWIVVYGVDKDDITSSVKALQKTLYLITILAVVIGALVTFIVSDSIARPIKKVTVAAQEIARGSFDVSLFVKSKDEVGQLAEAFNLTLARLKNYQGYIDEISQALSYLADGNLRISLQREYEGQFEKLKISLEALLEGLNDTMLQVYQVSDQVNSGSEQVANGAQALSQGATEQASSIEELSASIAEVANQIRTTANNAKNARDKAELAGKEMLTSTDQMDNMISAMKQITMKSSEISKIIKIIEDIAFQTNILSLNAAVEAARAGEAGKGFAVVADEVRNLAAKSAEAAKNTTVLIEDTLKAVEYGSQVATETADSLNTSAQATKETVSLIDEIALSAQDQAVAIVQVNQGIGQVSSVVQSNAATAEQSAAASQELSAQANLLKDLLSKFQLR